MKRIVLLVVFVGVLLGSVRLPGPTYYRDVLPILQQHCVSCHRPGQIAPMSFLTYADTRPWADAIKQVVSSGRMPPWPRGMPTAFREADHVLR